jgi:hypothetical protein
MIPGVRGRLVTAAFVRDVFPELAPERPPAAFRRALDSLWGRIEAGVGPASSIRAVADVVAIPLIKTLGLSVAGRDEADGLCRLRTDAGGRPGPPVVTLPWAAALDSSWRAAVTFAASQDSRWTFCVNGPSLRIVDARRTWTRSYLEFDLAVAAVDPEPAWLLWAFARGAAITADEPLLDRSVEASAKHGRTVCRALGDGMLTALGLLLSTRHADRVRPPRRKPGRVPVRTAVSAAESFDFSVTVLYRVLFLLFAEARALVPIWHGVYRERYSVQAIVSALLDGRPCHGLWQAIQAISRLAHAGCSAGDLQVNAFNGRLFSPAVTTVMERTRIPDEVMARAIAALGTTSLGRYRRADVGTAASRRERIIYRDLDVEQLGAVYEQVLDYRPSERQSAGVLARTRDARKESGTFYTPRQITAVVVRAALAPLVAGRSADEILALRVLDPAMGSGAFLVAACRYLAAAVEEALIRDGAWHPGDVTPEDRVSLRRQVALRCLYGVDLNPTAVQLARLSLWLATLAADRPLSFLDHHLLAGDSLVGARVEDVRQRPTMTPGRRVRDRDLPLFPDEGLGEALGGAAHTRQALAATPDDSAAVVREKERTLASLNTADTPVRRWWRLLDLWCARWFWGDDAPDRAAFLDLAARILGASPSLPAPTAAGLLERSDAVAAERRFLHWPLAFPEVFGGAAPGFDAVVGNPPWDMVRGDSGQEAERRARRTLAGQLTGFARESGVYRVESAAHVNSYQLFLERTLQLVRPGGRIGLALPSGLASDAGASPLRRHLFDRVEVDSMIGVSNTAAIFPVHRSVRFLVLTGTAGRPTHAFQCRFGLTTGDEVEEAAQGRLFTMSRAFLSRVSGADDLGVPEVARELDLRIVERISATVPRLGAGDGWNVTFGRELNASDDRPLLRTVTGRPGARLVVEGKQIDAFRASLGDCRFELKPDAAIPGRVGTAARLAYRDVASATNRLTLIAAIVPAGAVTTHTLFCLRTPLGVDDQYLLCALLNSFVANFLVRLRVNTHVTVALVRRLPVPRLRATDGEGARLSALAAALARARAPVDTLPEYAELQARVARAYNLTRPAFEHIVSTFPLVAAEARAGSLRWFARLAAGAGETQNSE